MNDKYNKAYMNTAENFAECSTATRLKVGCILVKDRHIISEGLNGSPRGWPTNECENPVTGLTEPYVLHAEANSILKAARAGISTAGATAYTTHSPCSPCSLLLIGAGIIKVIYKHKYRCTEGMDMLKSAGIIVEEYKE